MLIICIALDIGLPYIHINPSDRQKRLCVQGNIELLIRQQALMLDWLPVLSRFNIALINVEGDSALAVDITGTSPPKRGLTNE